LIRPGNRVDGSFGLDSLNFVYSLGSTQKSITGRTHSTQSPTHPRLKFPSSGRLAHCITCASTTCQSPPRYYAPHTRCAVIILGIVISTSIVTWPSAQKSRTKERQRKWFIQTFSRFTQPFYKLFYDSTLAVNYVYYSRNFFLFVERILLW